jgi:hypothetical protein
MEEKAFLEKYLKKFKYKWTTYKIHSSKEYFDESLLEKNIELLSKVYELQKENEDIELSSLILFSLSSSLYTKTYKYMLYVASGNLYIDKPLVLNYWKPEKIDEEVANIRKELKSSIYLEEQRLEEAIRFVLEGYNYIVAGYWNKVVERIVKTETFMKIKKGKDFKILSGAYMGELRQIKVSIN